MMIWTWIIGVCASIFFFLAPTPQGSNPEIHMRVLVFFSLGYFLAASIGTVFSAVQVEEKCEKVKKENQGYALKSVSEGKYRVLSAMINVGRIMIVAAKFNGGSGCGVGHTMVYSLDRDAFDSDPHPLLGKMNLEMTVSSHELGTKISLYSTNA